jgi:hypothetical protein
MKTPEELEKDHATYEHLCNLNKIHEYDEKEKAKSEEIAKAFEDCKESLSEALKEGRDMLYKK